MKDRLSILDTCVHRLEWKRMEEERKLKEQGEEDINDLQRSAFFQIDWHDFVVVGCSTAMTA